MPGKESVYQRRANTGAATVLGGSSFDPVQFSKYAGQLKAADKAAQDKSKQKTLDDLYRNLSIKRGAVLDSDIPVIDSYENEFYNWKAEGVSNLLGGRGMTPQDAKDGYRYKQQFQQFNDNSVSHRKMLDTFVSAYKSGSKDLDTDAMANNAAIYTDPSLFVDDNEEVKNTWTPIYETVMEDPVYSRDPEKAKIIANNLWRNEHPEYVRDPIYSDVKLLEHWKTNGIPLISENKKYVGRRTADGTEITEEYLAKLPFDTEVEIEGGEKVTLVGSRHVANDFYDTDPAIQKSANNLFNKQVDETKERYIDQYGEEDAAKEYYMDLVSPYGVETSSKEITKAPLPKTGMHRFGNKTYGFEAGLDEGERNFNRLGVWETNDGKNTNKGIEYGYAKVPFRGIAFGSDSKKYPTVKVNPKRIFNQDSYSWMPSDKSQEWDITVSGVYEAPGTTERIDLSQPEWAPLKEWARKTYGKTANTAIAEQIKKGNWIVEEGTVVSADEAREINRIKQGIVKSRKYASGQVSGRDIVNQKNIEIAGGLIPWEEVEDKINLATDGNWGAEIDNAYGGGDDWWQTKIRGNDNSNQSNNDVTPKTDPIKDMKEKAKTTDQGDQKKDSNGDVVFD